MVVRGGSTALPPWQHSDFCVSRGEAQCAASLIRATLRQRPDEVSVHGSRAAIGTEERTDSDGSDVAAAEGGGHAFVHV